MLIMTMITIMIVTHNGNAPRRLFPSAAISHRLGLPIATARPPRLPLLRRRRNRPFLAVPPKPRVFGCPGPARRRVLGRKKGKDGGCRLTLSHPSPIVLSVCLYIYIYIYNIYKSAAAATASYSWPCCVALAHSDEIIIIIMIIITCCLAPVPAACLARGGCSSRRQRASKPAPPLLRLRSGTPMLRDTVGGDRVEFNLPGRPAVNAAYLSTVDNDGVACPPAILARC